MRGWGIYVERKEEEKRRRGEREKRRKEEEKGRKEEEKNKKINYRTCMELYGIICVWIIVLILVYIRIICMDV